MGKYYTEKKLTLELSQEEIPTLTDVEYRWDVEEYKADLLVKLLVDDLDAIDLNLLDSLVGSWSETLKLKIEVIVEENRRGGLVTPRKILHR